MKSGLSTQIKMEETVFRRKSGGEMVAFGKIEGISNSAAKNEKKQTAPFVVY